MLLKTSVYEGGEILVKRCSGVFEELVGDTIWTYNLVVPQF